jgi:choline dehydrogenase
LADTTYDYIIVGAGSAGCVLADRLTRDGKSSVLLLEAGSANDSMYIHMPRGFMKVLYHRDFYWKFPIEKEGDREPGETFHYGKGLGGSSAVNGTWYYRGYPGDYDQWEGFGAEGWNWAAIQMAYSEMEDYTEPGAHASRGKGGPLQVTVTRDNSALTKATIEAGRQMGLPVLDDINTPATESVGPTQMTVDRRGRRSSAHAAFLKHRAGRRLEIKTGALVQKVTFEGRRATGVICRIGGTEQTFTAAREVIVSAGVLQSPKILQLSGIGAPELLAKHDMPLIHANPEVGRNLGDHMMLRMSFKLKNAEGLNREFRGWRLLKNVAQYYLRRTGLMAVNVPGVSAMLSSTGDKA